jgi:asparagine synthase (glutamine-hydrolysing)
MSGIAALFHRDGRPVDPESPLRMLDAIAHHRPGRRDTWIGRSVAMGHAGLVTSCEAAEARQPLASADGALSIVFDGRIDNRDELDSLMGGVRTRSDAATVLGAYTCWGDACFSRLLGDFACVIWDARRQQLVCARDVVGLRPLYYFVDDKTFACGSEPQQLFAGGLTRTDINEGMVAEYLADEMTSRDETLFQHVWRLPAAHVAIVTPSGVTKRRYFDLDPTVAIRYRTDDEYAEHFLVLLREAIRCRVADQSSIAAYLSGGLDSSSVVSLLEDQRRHGPLRDLHLQTLSMVAGGPAADERMFIDAVATMWNVPGRTFVAPPPDPHVFVDLARQYRDAPDHPNVVAAGPLAEAARDDGVRVVLTGLGGDDWLCAYGTHASALHSFIRQRVWPHVPDVIRAAVRRARHRPRAHQNRGAHYVRPEFTRRIALNDRIAPPAPDPRCATVMQNELYQWMSHGNLAYSNEIDARHHSRFGLDARHPFHDRRLIEFALAIPERQRWRGTQPKFVLRRAMQYLLPDLVRVRLTKGDYSATFVEAFDACGGERSFNSLETADRGWVDGNLVVTTYRDMRRRFSEGDARYSAYTRRLWMLLGIEFWLKRGRT